jgi:2-methylcitrate dehydratase PrpD
MTATGQEQTTTTAAGPGAGAEAGAGTAASPTPRLASFLASVRLADIPEEVVVRANHLVLDGIACALVGAHLPWSQTAVRSVAALEGGGPASVLGWDLRVPPTAAALLNGTFIQGFELDDYHEHGPLHSASIILPAGFATAESMTGVTGERLALAMLLGFEVGPRVGVAMDAYAMIRHGWHCGSVLGVVGAAATAASLRGLDAAGIEDAIGIACTQACGLMSAQYESMVKRMNHAFAARAGVLAGGLAAGGFTGIKRVLEREFGGFFGTFCADHETDISKVTDRLGEHWELLRILVKPYASGGTTHPVADAMLHARTELGVTPENLRSVTIRVPEGPFKHNGWKLERPTTAIGAQINMGYVGAVMLVDGAAFVSQFAPDRINADDVWSVLDRITILHDPEMDELARRTNTPRATRVSIELVDGKRHDLEILNARGTGKKILTNAQITEKFRALLADLVDDARAEEIVRRTCRLHELADAEELLELLRPTVAAPF